MPIRPATQVGNPVIRAKSKPVVKVTTPEVKRIVKNLIDSMRYHNLVGMAAPQIGIGKRIFVTEIRETKTRKPRQPDSVRVFVNPKILAVSRKQVSDYEGCGSVAHSGIFGIVKRPLSVIVEAQDLKGKKFTLRASGLLARVIQHETDHLNGILFMDRMADTRTLIAREELLKRG